MHYYGILCVICPHQCVCVRVFVILACLPRDKHICKLLLIHDWLSPPPSSRGSLVLLLWCNRNPCSSARLCLGVFVRACVRVRLTVPPLLLFDVASVCQLTKCTAAAPAAQTHHRLAKNYVWRERMPLFSRSCGQVVVRGGVIIDEVYSLH